MYKRFFKPMVILPVLMAVFIGVHLIRGAGLATVRMVVDPLLMLIMLAVVRWHFVQSAKRAVAGIRKIGTPEGKRIFGFRKWKFWIVCGSLFVIVLFIFAVADARKWTIYQEGLQDVRNSPIARAAFGSDVKPSLLSNSWMETHGDSGEATVDMSISGDHGSGRLYIHGVESGGQWKIVDLYIIQNGSGTRIDVAH